MCGMPQWNRLRAGLRQEECGLGGVGWSGWSTDGRISSLFARHHLGIAVRRHRHSEHRTAVDHALTQLLEHSVGLLHREHAEHWRNYLHHISRQPHKTTSHALLITNSNVTSLRSWRVAHGKQPLTSSRSTLTALHVSISLTRWRLDWRFLLLWFSRQTLHFTQCSTCAQVSTIRLRHWNGISMIRSKTNEKLSSKKKFEDSDILLVQINETWNMLLPEICATLGINATHLMCKKSKEWSMVWVLLPQLRCLAVTGSTPIADLLKHAGNWKSTDVTWKVKSEPNVHRQ